MNMDKELIIEASILAHKINLARFESVIPSDEDTVRLCTILDILACQYEEI
jgi:hypothetical protein